MMNFGALLDKVPVLRHLSAGGQAETEIKPEDIPDQPTVTEVWDRRQKAIKNIFSASPQFRELKSEEQDKIIRLSLTNPEVFMNIVQNDPVLKKQWSELKDEERRAFASKFLSPAEQPLKEPYLDPTVWLPIGMTRQILTKGAAGLVDTVGAVAVGDIAGEMAKQTYEAVKGKEAPWWVGIGADVLSGFSPDIIKKLTKIFTKTKTPEEAVKVLDDLEAKLPEGKQKEAVKEVKRRVTEIYTSPQVEGKVGTGPLVVEQKGKLEISGETQEPVKTEKALKEVPEDFYLYSGGPSTKEIREFFKIPEDPLKQAPTEIAEQAKLSRLATLGNIKRWVLPQYEWLKQDARTVKVYRAAKDYTEGLEKDIKKWLGDRLEDIKKRLSELPEEERLRIADYIEGKAGDISETGKELAGTVRRFLDDIYDYAKERGLNISYRENYFPHVFEGHIRVQVGDELKSAKTWDEAIEIAHKGMEEGEKVKIKAMLDPNIYELKITNPRFWRLVSKLEEGVEFTEDEIKTLLKEAGIGRRPRYRYVSNLLQRKYDIEGYIKDPEVALSVYTFNIIKKIHQDRFLKELERAYEKIREPRLRGLLEEYKELVLGYPTKPERVTADLVNSFFKTPLGRWFLAKAGKSLGTEVSPFDIRRGGGKASFWLNYFNDLALSFSSALVNLTQFLTTTIPSLGGKKSALKGALKYTRGLFKEQKLKNELFEAGILTETTFEGLKFNPKFLPDLTMAPFSGAEVFNRVATYGAAKEYGLKEGVEEMSKVLDLLGVPKHDPLYELIQNPKVSLEKKAMEFAKEVVDKTQFRYEKFSSPRLLSGSLGKLIAPYKTFLINYLLLSYRMLTKTKAHPREAILFFSVPVLLAGKDGNPILRWTWDYALAPLYAEITGKELEEDVKEKLGKLGNVLIEGVPRQVGVDIRGAVKLDFPTPFKEEFYGRPVRLLKKAQEVIRGEKGTEELRKELTPRFIKNLSEAWEIYKTGFIKDSKGRIIGRGGEEDAILRAFGIRPPEYYDFLDKKELIYKADKKFAVDYDPLINDFVNALINGDRKEVTAKAREITKALKKLSEKVQSSSGQRQKVYLYLYLKLTGALEPEAIERRVRNRLIPFGSDKKKLMLAN